jgi:hypothetical protein
MQAPGCDKTYTPPKSYLPQSDLYEGKSTLCITEGNLLARKFGATGLASSQQEGRSVAWSREILQIFTGGPDKNIAIEVLLFSRRATLQLERFHLPKAVIARKKNIVLRAPVLSPLILMSP